MKSVLPCAIMKSFNRSNSVLYRVRWQLDVLAEFPLHFKETILRI